jgi:prepilin signal peptidase PulO-like enzyme (type II secretory pathway)
MIIFGLVLLGLCFGSFVNALIWRVHEQNGKKKNDDKLSIAKGRSMCPHCRHELATKDLIPVLSWLSLRGKCRYCGKSIGWQYPVVEISLATLYVASYIWWPVELNGLQIAVFGVWLVLLIGLLALLVYDVRWSLLPNRILYPLGYVAGLMALLAVIDSAHPFRALLNVLLAVIVGGGIFYALFQLSAGKWIGGGDVKLGWLLGLVLMTPGKAFLMIFLAAILGSLVSLPLLLLKRLDRKSTIPFGPFLIVAAIIAQLFGHSIILWYQKAFVPFTL